MARTSPPTLAMVSERSRAAHLAILGGLHPAPGDPGLPAACRTLLLLGPGEPGFWDHVTAAPEFDDGRPNPLDRWSRRTVGRLACDLGAKALFPFKGPPWLPFLGWAQRTGRFWTSPIGMLVHAEAGLLVSIRGALALREEIALPPPLPQPCDGCPDKPCRTTCPVDAFTPDGYAVDRCRAWVASASGADCRNAGCRARRACPVSATYPRMAAQSAFHMRAFLEA